MATMPEGLPVGSVGGQDGVPRDRAVTRLKVFGKEWGGVLVSAVTVLGAFAAILGWIDSRMESRMDRFEARMEQRMAAFEVRMEQRFDEFEARMNQRMDELEARMGLRMDELEARMILRFEAVDARLEEMERRILRLEEVVRDLAERLARVEGHLEIPEPSGGEAGASP